MTNHNLDALMERAYPMDTSAGPGQIAAALGDIEDELATHQNDHAHLTGQVKRREKFIETYVATLYELVDARSCSNPTERMIFAKADLHRSKEYTEYLSMVEELEEHRKRLDYLDTRRSIGQTILRRGHDQGDDPRWGQEAQPAGPS